MSIALASANFLTYSGGEDIGTVLSSKLPGITVNDRPACFSRYRRRGDLEANIKRGSVSVFGIRSLLTNATGFDNDAKTSEKDKTSNFGFHPSFDEMNYPLLFLFNRRQP
jgi:hypothetical protein